MSSESSIPSIKTFYILYLFHFIILPFGFLIRLLYSKTLSLEEFGIIYAIFGFFAVISIFTNLGLSESLTYFIPKYIIKKELDKIRNLFYYNVIIQFSITLIFSILIFSYINFLATHYFKTQIIIPYLKIFLIYFIFSNFTSSICSVFIAFKKNIYYQSVTLFQFSFILFFSLIAFVLNLNNLINYYALIWVLSTMITFFIYVLIFFKNFPYIFSIPKFEKKLFVEYFKYSLFMFINNLSSTILIQIDIIIITYFYGLTSIAIYTNALSITTTLFGIFNLATIFFIPIFSELKEKKNYNTINNILNFLYSFLFFLILPLSIVLFMFSKIPILFLFGDKYIESAQLLAIFSLFSIINLFNQYNISFMSGLGMGKKLSKILIISVFANLIFNLIMIKLKLGLIGVLYAVVMTWIFIFILTYNALSLELKFKINIKKNFIIILNGIIFTILIFLMKRIIIFNNFYLNSLFILIITLFIYFILGYILKIYTIQEFYLFIPNETLKNKMTKYHEKYFNFLK